LDSAFKVHKELGPGLLESVYETCLFYELKKLGLKVEKQVKLPIGFDGIKLDADLRLDIWLYQKLIIEVKSVEKMLPVLEAQLLTYLKMTKNRLGLLLNFNVPLLKQGIKRIVL
jgi:GxxExxY protein